MITDSPDPELMRCVLELVYFCEIEHGKFNPTGRELITAAQGRIRRRRNLSDTQPIADAVSRQIHIQVSNLLRRIKEARNTDITRLVRRERKKLFFPIAALAPEAKRRIYEYLAKPMRDNLREIHEMADRLTYRDVAISGATALLQDLSRRFGVREAVSTTESVAVLRASLDAARVEYSELKLKFQSASPNVDTSELERSVEKAQEHMNEISGKLQKLLRGGS